MEEAIIYDTVTGSMGKFPADAEAATELEEDEEERALSIIPVHRNNVGISLPAADEIHADQPSRSLFTSRRFKIIAIVTIVITTFVCIGVGISLSTKKLAVDLNKMSLIIDYLVQEEAATHDQFQETNSPQSKAAKWMSISTQWDVPSVSIRDDIGYRFLARYVMAVNFFSLNGSQWIDQMHFLNHNMDICDWDGVVLHGTEVIKKAGVICDPNKRPIMLNLYSNNLQGTIPTENGLLTTLMAFNFEYNQLKGSIPTELCQLTNLQVLALGNNKLNRKIPECIGDKLINLERLLLDHNELTGELPSSIDKLKSLEQLLLTDNFFRGDPSAVFNRLHNLKILLVDKNFFETSIDRNFLPNHNVLEWLDLSGNEFKLLDNSLPTHFFKLPALQVLDLSVNRFSGTLPIVIPENNVLQFFSAYGNSFKGDIPSALNNLKKLEHLDLSANHFRGELHSDLGRMTNLRFLYLGDNPKLRHGPIPAWLGNLTQLRDLSMHETNRTGEIPSFIGNLTNLEFLDLSSNKHLTYNMGTSNWGHLKNLEFLVLNENPNITGSIPSSFSNMKKLRAVFLDATSISENVQSLCELPAFANPTGDEVIVADCGGTNPTFNCSCCDCCSANQVCSVLYTDKLRLLSDVDFQKMNFQFDNLTRFMDMDNFFRNVTERSHDER